jgi:hypothetical protein
MKPRCSVDGCDRETKSRGLCNKHYENARIRGLPVGPDRYGRELDLRKCKIDGCTRFATRLGMCHAHAAREKKRALGARPLSSMTPEIRRKSKHGDGAFNKDGYRIIFVPGHPNAHPNGTISEHRYVMAQHIGRPLRPGENVHHKNGVRTDNRIENLELWVEMQPRGQKLSDKLQWCRDFLAEYSTPPPTDIRNTQAGNAGF